ncbi:hypothetical protein EDD16DRAFT_610931 [Pisolithus croceorrhizus]|nr:hypothetical protein EDD16DRAFT_610931 [Pisolithus croceorrhizus]
MVATKIKPVPCVGSFHWLSFAMCCFRVGLVLSLPIHSRMPHSVHRYIVSPLYPLIRSGISPFLVIAAVPLYPTRFRSVSCSSSPFVAPHGSQASLPVAATLNQSCDLPFPSFSRSAVI